MTAGTELAESLLAAARVSPVEANPIVTGVVAGTLPREVVRRYAVTIAAMAEAFPRRICAVLSICDEADVRRSLLGNLLEEEGVTAILPEHGLRVDPERRHGTIARRFARAAGATDADVDAIQVPPARWFADAIRDGDWIGAFSFFAIGFEANVPATFRALVDPLITNYGFTGDELAFLYEHFTADERHGVESAYLIARVATDGARRGRALEGARRGGIGWRALHRSIALAHVPA
jgi:pyrroloquinoline quinone (PQQ) biosynthesis protein C